ncbi:excisionase family DNA binding protein [Streptacidiphilus sp. MAP12-16]|uniref:Excisionase family DNA-binding protein n=1 Tax=Streptacidiphilus cavernicola TaxID=3342716 RepID=A0ABV6VVA6_9ACTN
MTDCYLSVAQVAEILGTTERFPRRLIAERRIPYLKAGKHVRIARSALDAYIAANLVPASPRRTTLRRSV